MAWRIHDQVVRGEIDNRIRGRVTGSIWLAGRPQPVRLELTGDAWRDVAGRKVTFVNREPVPGDLDGFAELQAGCCGDLTASRKVRVPTIPIEAWDRTRGPLPTVWANSVYFEWFSERNGRVVIEAHDYQLTISEPTWEATEADELNQRLQNAKAMNQFMLALNQALSHGENTPAQPSDWGSESPLAAELQKLKTAPTMKRREMLALDEVRVTPPEEISEDDLPQELWKIIAALARWRHFLMDTDHLSDRELYVLLHDRILDEETMVISDPAWNCHICVSEYGPPGDEDGEQLYLRYYADERTREKWAQHYPHITLPEQERLPYDRDWSLPGPHG